MRRRYADGHVPSLYEEGVVSLVSRVLFCHWRGNYDQRVEARYLSDADNERRLARAHYQFATGCKPSDDKVTGKGMAAQE